MSKFKDYYVAACNKRGVIIYTRSIRAQSAIEACSMAKEDMRRTNTVWQTVWTGDPMHPDFMKSTKEG